MAKSRKQKSAPVTPPAPPLELLSGWRWVAVLAAVVIVFYWMPLTSSTASIQWDAVDVHYSSQKYLAERIRKGNLPHWTPYLFSGFPFLADPQVGAWYPLNWPFFLTGISPRAIQVELALHALAACAGAFLLFRNLLGHSTAALVGACAYGLSGFFAGHSSHVGMFSAAALLPWLLWCFRMAMEASLPRYAALGGLVGGAMILAGHFQTALYGLAALVLFAIGDQIAGRGSWIRMTGFLIVTALLAVLLSAVQTLPGLELASQSIRAGADYGASREGVLAAGGLATLVHPNFLGVFAEQYTGPDDLTQHYFYAGILLLPLAALGLRNKALRVPALLLLVPSLWYMAGPAAGLYRLGALLPGFHRVRSPVNGWFLVAFALALLAACGVVEATSRWKWKHLGTLAAVLLIVDLCWFNSWTNLLAYGRFRFDDVYGEAEQRTATMIAATQPPLTRFHALDKLAALGPMNHPLDLRLEATYGYNPLELAAYTDYRAAMNQNPRLLPGLNVSRRLDASNGLIVPVSPVLARASFPRSVISVSAMEESKRLLPELDPAEKALVLKPHGSIEQDPNATATVEPDGEQGYRIRYRAASPSLLRVSVPCFPGWKATLNGTPLDVLRVNHAFLGVVVPAGEGVLTLRFESRWFQRGVLLSLLGTLITGFLFVWRHGSKKGGL